MIDDSGRILVVRRRGEPGRGLWALPGGPCDHAEQPQQTCVRETLAESGISVRPERFAGRVVRNGPTEWSRYVIDDYICAPTGGALRPADVAAAAMWVTSDTFRELPLMNGLLDTLTEWGVLDAMETRRRRRVGRMSRPTTEPKQVRPT